MPTDCIDVGDLVVLNSDPTASVYRVASLESWDVFSLECWKPGWGWISSRFAFRYHVGRPSDRQMRRFVRVISGRVPPSPAGSLDSATLVG